MTVSSLRSFGLTYARRGQHGLQCTQGTDTQGRNGEPHIWAVDPASVDFLITCFCTCPPFSLLSNGPAQFNLNLFILLLWKLMNLGLFGFVFISGFLFFSLMRVNNVLAITSLIPVNMVYNYCFKPSQREVFPYSHSKVLLTINHPTLFQGVCT